MKRSKVNEILRAGDEFIRSFGYVMPPFAYLSPKEMRAQRDRLGTIVDRRLGWDITDYGQGDFDRLGLFLFTARNGDAADLTAGRGMLYAEKIMISRPRPGVADAPAHREGRRHHQPRRRDAGAGILRKRPGRHDRRERPR